MQSALPACVVELSTDADLTGLGIAPISVRAQIETAARELLLGSDPRAVTASWERLLAAQADRGRANLSCTAIAALDAALWDLKAKANAEPLWKTLGGARPKANAHAGSPEETLGEEELAAWYLGMARDFGLRGAVLRASADPQADLRCLAQVRAALLTSTPDPVMMLDAQESWTPTQVIDRLREMEEQFDLTWIEGAARRGDFSGAKDISNAISAAVCVGRALANRAEFLPHLQHRSADVVQLDIDATGITGALQLADAAFGFELPVTLCAAPGNIHAHLSSVMPYFMSMEVVDAAPGFGSLAGDVRIENGLAIAGDAPGHGLVAVTDPSARQRAGARDSR